MLASPEVVHLVPQAPGTLVWRCPRGTQALSSAPVGGGRGTPRWILNIGVGAGYNRTDLTQHAAEVARSLACDGAGSALFTSARIEHCRRSEVDGVSVDCTAGIGKPTFAASQDQGWSTWSAGTINVVAALPHPLSEAAAVNAIVTITEAKCQALDDLGVPGTGTATDAVVVLWPSDGSPESFCGPRSRLGAPLANAAFNAVKASSLASHPDLR